MECLLDIIAPPAVASGAARALIIAPEGATSFATPARLAAYGLIGDISRRGTSAPVAATGRWIVERTHAWLNAFKKLVWCTERRLVVVDFWLTFAAVVVIVRRLVREGWTRYRWDDRPTRKP